MKKFVMTAAALMLGTSALAWAPAEKAHLQAASMETASEWSAQKSPLGFAAFDDKSAMKTQSAAVEASTNWAKSEPLGMKTLAKTADAGVETASWSGETKVPDDGGITIAEADFKSKDDVGGIQTASVETKAGKLVETGMGGPLEPATGYPPCDPGPGDDRCIQLYEPGVATALAAWKGADAGVAMGGPFEPAATGTKDQSAEQQAMDHGSASGHAGHDMSASAKPTAGTADAGTDAGATTTKPTAGTATTGTTPGSIGGPIEQRTGYPACSATVTDSCIQLYERGVTGRGN